MNNQFSENLKKIRKEHHLSQEQLADELGVSRQAISKWESSAAYPEMDKIIALCDKFNLNIDDLLHKDIKEVKGEEESKRKLNNIIDDFLKFITDTINLFCNMNFKSKIKCLIEQAIIILILFIISSIMNMIIGHLFNELFEILPNNLETFIRSIFYFIFNLFCVVASFVIIIHIFKTRYLNYYNDLKMETDNEKTNINDEINDNKVELKNNEKKIIIRDPKHSEYRFINILFKIVIWIIKLFVLGFALYVAFALVCLFIAFILSFLVYKTGIFFIGLLISILSCSVIAVIVLMIALNFIFNRKNDKKKMIYSFIIALISLGIGIGLSITGSLNFDVLEDNESMLKDEIIEYEMKDNMFIYPEYGVEINYVEKNINNIKIEYSINSFCKSEASEEKGMIHLNAYCDQPTKMIREFLKKTNDKKIIVINDNIERITVYANSENIKKLQNNLTKYNEERIKQDNIIEEYERRISELQQENNKLTNDLDNCENN